MLVTGSDWDRVPGAGERNHGWCAASWMHPDAGGEVLWNSERLSQHKGDFFRKNKYSVHSCYAKKVSLKSASFHVSPQSFQDRMKTMPAVKDFLKPGSQRKPPPDDNYVQTALKVFNIQKLPFLWTALCSTAQSLLLINKSILVQNWFWLLLLQY